MFLKSHMLFVWIYSVPLYVCAQNIEEDVTRMYKNYENSQAVEVQIDVSAYDREEHLEYRFSGTVVQYRGDFYQRNDLMIYMQNKRYQILVLFEEKEIIYRKKQPQTPYSSEIDRMTSYSDLLDTLMQSYDTVIDMGLRDHVRYYQIQTSASPIQEIIMGIDTTTYWLKDIAYTYRDDVPVTTSQVFIEYAHRILADEEVDQWFSENQYIRKTKEGYIPAEAFSEYSLIDNTN